jgi:pimeloyl-ACP methyl ester carboxylesterase
MHRLVFFIGGFDPKSARFYHRLYRDAARGRPRSAQQESVQVGERFQASDCVDAWDLRWQVPGDTPLLTRYAVLRWDDVVRSHWARTVRQTLQDYWRIYGLSAAQGVLRQIRRDAPEGFWLAVLPLVLALATLAATVAGAVGLVLLEHVSPGLAALAVLPLWLLLWRGIERRLGTEWLLRLYGFTWAQAQQRLPDLEQRLDSLARQVVAQVAANPPREVLVVGHSTGSIMAVSVLARALAEAPWLADSGPALGLLTLGHCTPILERLPAAQRFRGELRQLADTPGLTWVDLSAPADWAAFFRTPPWRQGGRARLRQASPRFHAHLHAKTYARLLQHRDQLHLQYLKAPDLPGGYDLVGWTAGPAFLSERLGAVGKPGAQP